MTTTKTKRCGYWDELYFRAIDARLDGEWLGAPFENAKCGVCRACEFDAREARAAAGCSTPADLVVAVRSHARDNYDVDCWDHVIECWTDAEIAAETAGCSTPAEAIETVGAVVNSSTRRAMWSLR